MTKSERAVGTVRRPITLALVAALVCWMLALAARDVRAESAAQIPISKAPELLKLADQAGFKTKELSHCERKLLRLAPIGKFAVCGPNMNDKDPQNDPSKSDKWAPSRQIRAELIRWLCVDEAARKLIDPKGIRIYGAKVMDPLDLDFVSVPFPIWIVKSRILSPMSLEEANIEALNMGGTWTGPITADRLTTRGPIFLRYGFHAEGGVDLQRATVGGDLDCHDAIFIKQHPKTHGFALNADRIKVAGNIFLQNSKATGEVWLPGATAGGNLEVDNGIFSNPGRRALTADGVTVAGYVFLRWGFTAMGEVRLLSATVGSDLDCRGAIFTPGSKLNAERARISGEFWWTGISDGSNSADTDHVNPNVRLDLTGAHAASVTDDENSWPEHLALNGFTYDRFEITTDTGAAVPRDADSRLAWLHRQDSSRGLATQPYEQLAKVLDSEGDEPGARQVRIAMEDDLRTRLPWYRQIWPWVLKWTIGYGYEPWIALWWALGFVLLGYPLFALGYCVGVIGPTDHDAFVDFQQAKLSPAYLPFSACLFSLDTFLPIVNLGLKERWMLNPNLAPPANVRNRFPHLARWLEPALRTYWLLHVFAGWVLITLFAAGFTGIIRR
ncbi:MAG: hypothetical protein ACLQBA_21620 [Candidatus Binataceae bacterium]